MSFPLFFRLLLLCSPLISLVWVVPAAATNGMNLIGYGAVSTGMGGADLAIVDSASAMNINPAALCDCNGPEMGVGLSLLKPQLHHRDDAFGNDLEGEENIFALPLITYASSIDKLPLVFGIGLFSQGGMGAEYNSLRTPFGNSDELYSNVTYAKVTPTLAWRKPGSNLKLGASLNLGYVTTDFRLFPGTSVAAASFAGMRAQDLSALGAGARLGFQYRLGALSIGGAWLSRTDLSFDGGDLTLDFSDAGFGALGKVTYDAEMKGFNWPQQAGFGFSYQFTRTFRLAADIDWIEWSRAMDKIKVTGSSPDNPSAPASVAQTINMDWNDQWVFALGSEWEFREDWLLRLGYNHGDSPVPDGTLSPLFPAIIEDHLTLGLGVRDYAWQFDAAVEYAFEAEQTNNNPDPMENIFGPGSTESHEQVLLHLMFRYFF